MTAQDGGVGSGQGVRGEEGAGRGGLGERAHRPVLQGLLNLHIPVHLALGQAQECPLM